MSTRDALKAWGQSMWDAGYAFAKLELSLEAGAPEPVIHDELHAVTAPRVGTRPRTPAGVGKKRAPRGQSREIALQAAESFGDEKFTAPEWYAKAKELGITVARESFRIQTAKSLVEEGKVRKEGVEYQVIREPQNEPPVETAALPDQPPAPKSATLNIPRNLTGPRPV